MTVRTRFAPSPTGQLHVGGARTAILSWLFARNAGGVFVLRIEDTDRERNVGGAEAALLEDLAWLGLDWDEGPGVEGAFGPYRQSDRAEHYRHRADQLLAAGHAYPCTCPPGASEVAGAPRRCPCADRPRGEWPADGSPSLRFRVPDGGTVTVYDRVRGDVHFESEHIEDFVLLRSDGVPTYNFACVVDDAAMRVTDVIRGGDHLINTPKQILIFQALGEPLPSFAHVPLILGPDRQKLSKRHGATHVSEYRRLGILPEALVNYLSLLAWSSPSGEELLTRARLVEEIDLDRVGAADAVFDTDKLRWMSHEYIQRLPLADLVDRLAPYLGPNGKAIPDAELPIAVAAIRPRISALGEAERELAVFAGFLADADQTARTTLFADAAAAPVLAAAAEQIAAAEWTADGIKAALRKAGEQAGVKGKALFLPVRVAVTGADHGPELPALMQVLGRSRVRERLAGAMM